MWVRGTPTKVPEYGDHVSNRLLLLLLLLLLLFCPRWSNELLLMPLVLGGQRERPFKCHQVVSLDVIIIIIILFLLLLFL